MNYTGTTPSSLRRPASRRVALIAALAMALAIAVFAGTAMANSSAFAFTMELRFVSGERNKKTHALDAGELTLNGNLWVTSKKARSTSKPKPIAIRVAETGLLGSTICTVSVTPDTIFNNKVPFSRSCGRIKGGTYWIEVSKDQAIDKTGDGWHLQGAGTLTTK